MNLPLLDLGTLPSGSLMLWLSIWVCLLFVYFFITIIIVNIYTKGTNDFSTAPQPTGDDWKAGNIVLLFCHYIINTNIIF